MVVLNMSFGMVIFVNDFRGFDLIVYDKGEKLLWCKLVVFYRLVDFFGWFQFIYNYIIIRVNFEQEYFFIVFFGFFYSEVIVFSLVKINL